MEAPRENIVIVTIASASMVMGQLDMDTAISFGLDAEKLLPIIDLKYVPFLLKN